MLARSKQTDEWIRQLLADPARVWIYDKLAAVGLLVERERPEEEAKPYRDCLKLGGFLADYFDKRPDVKSGTLINWRHTRRNLLAFFGADKPLVEITLGDAKDFMRYLKTVARKMRYGDAEKAEGLKPATLAKRISNAKQFFAYAVDRQLIPRNPFSWPRGQTPAQRANRARDFFVTRDMAYRSTNANLRTQLRRIIRKAGLEPWPKLFQNLRASCETELMQRFPAHVVTAWIGHTEAIAQKHYLQVTEDDFQAATKAVQKSGANSPGLASSDREAVQVVTAKKRENPGRTACSANSPGSTVWAMLDSNQ